MYVCIGLKAEGKASGGNRLKTVMAETGADVPIKLTNNAFAMSAKDGEYVEFSSDCLCEGQVEVWLNRLMATMRDSIR